MTFVDAGMHNQRMLTQVLPGLRELRAPLASGALWLVGGWLVFRDLGVELPQESELRQAWRDAQSLIEPVGLAAVLAFVSYLLGVGLEPTWRWVWRKLQPVSATGLRVINQVVEAKLDRLRAEEVFVFAWTASAQGRTVMETAALENAAIIEAFDARLSETADARGEELLVRALIDNANGTLTKVRRELKRELVPAVVEELDMVAQRLLGDEREIFQAYDRARSESEFRVAVLLPMLITLVFALKSELAAEFFIIACPVLAYVFLSQARRQRASGGDHIAGALRYEAVEAPTLQPLKPGKYTLENLTSGALEVERVVVRESERWTGEPLAERLARRLVRGERFVDFTEAAARGLSGKSRELLRAYYVLLAPNRLYRAPRDAIDSEEQRRLSSAALMGDEAALLRVADFLRGRGLEDQARLRYNRLAARGMSVAHARLSAMALATHHERAAEDAARLALISARSPAERQLAEIAVEAAKRASSNLASPS